MISSIEQDVAARLQILHAQTRKFTLHPLVDLTLVAQALPLNVTGADIGGVTSAAYSTALRRKLSELKAQALAHLTHTESTKEPDDWAVQGYINQLDDTELVIAVQQSDLLHAARSIQPSVVDLDYYESLGDMYDDSRPPI